MALDFRDFGEGKAPDKFSATARRRWWTLEGKEAADAVTAELKLLGDQQSRRLVQHVRSARLYGNLPMGGFGNMSFAKGGPAPVQENTITYNVVQSCVDTAQSKMSKNKPKPLFLTSGGDYKIQRKAKKLNQFMDGVFYEQKAHDLGIVIFRDGEVFGDGVVHVLEKNGRVAYERVLSSELYVDEQEAKYGKPRRMHYVIAVDRSVLESLFPDDASKISTAQAPKDNAENHQSVSDMVEVRESWHIPSGPKAKDGKHIISIDGHTLMAEDWTHDFFPFARFQWSPRLGGFWSQGLAEQIQSIQREINKLLGVIQRSFHLAGSFKVFIEQSSKIVKEHLNNDIGAIVSYTGTPPQYVTPPIVSPEIFQHLLTLKQSAYEQAGISLMNATSTKPAGLNSGKAIREYNDVGEDRMSTTGYRYQLMFMDLAKLSIATIKDIAAKNHGHYEVKVPGKKFLQTIDWSEIDLEEEEYVMQCFPVSSLPGDPSGRLQTIQEYAQAGYLTPRQAKRLLDFPDLEQVESLASAEEDYLTQILEKIVDKGEYTGPEPFDDLTLADELCSEMYAQGKSQGLEEERLDMLRQFRGQIEQYTKLAAASMAPPPGAPGPGMAGPQAAPMAPPTSDLLPNAPSPGLQ